MKNFIKLFLLSIIALCVIGCANPANNSNGDDENKPVDTTELKMALYEKLLGAWEAKEDEYIKEDWEDYYSVIFSSNSITFDGNVHSFSPSSETLLLEEEVPEEWRWKGETLYFYLNSKYYSVIIKDDNNITISYPGYDDYQERNNAYSSNYVKKSNAESGSSDTLDFSVVGDWSYTIAAGNTKTTFSIEDDGTFSFTKNSDVTNGTYSLSGNKITFKFTKDVVETEDTFTISGSEDEITLTLVESKTVTNGQTQTGTAISNMLLSFYTTTETTITLSK